MPWSIKEFYDNGSLHRLAVVDGKQIIHLRVYSNDGSEFPNVNIKGWKLGISGELIPPKGTVDPATFIGVDPASGDDNTVTTHVSRGSLATPASAETNFPDVDDSDSYRARMSNGEIEGLRTTVAQLLESLQEAYTLARRFSNRDFASGEDLMECIRELEYITETAIRRVDRDDR